MRNYTALTVAASYQDIITPAVVTVVSSTVSSATLGTDPYAKALPVLINTLIATNYDTTNTSTLNIVVTDINNNIKSYIHSNVLKPGESVYIDTDFYLAKTDKLRASSTGTTSVSIIVTGVEGI